LLTTYEAAAQLAVNEISPSPATLGTLNAVALTMSSAARAVMPGLFSSLFATGVRSQILAGYLAWAVLIASVLILIILTQFLPPAITHGRQDAKSRRK
jgi:hypothetical protein